MASAVQAWLGERLLRGRLIRGNWHDWLLHPVRAIPNPLDYLGLVTLVLVALQVLTGVLLTFHYVPSAEGAYGSIGRLQDASQVQFGTVIRGMHFWGAQMLVVSIGAHIGRGYAAYAYRRPREMTWISGVLMFILVILLAFTGYLLPWDQEAFWATQVGTAIAGYVPLVGKPLLEFVRGGPFVSGDTLRRFYALHILVLPGALIGLIFLHLYLVNIHGMAADELLEKKLARASSSAEAERRGLRYTAFWPTTVFQMTIVIVLTVALLAALALRWAAPLTAPADVLNRGCNPADFHVDPGVNPCYIPRPTWYFLWVFQLLRIFTYGSLGTLLSILIPGFSLGVLLLMPFIDAWVRHWRRVRIYFHYFYLAVGAAWVASIIWLTYLGLR